MRHTCNGFFENLQWRWHSARTLLVSASAGSFVPRSRTNSVARMAPNTANITNDWVALFPGAGHVFEQSSDMLGALGKMLRFEAAKTLQCRRARSRIPSVRTARHRSH